MIFPYIAKCLLSAFSAVCAQKQGTLEDINSPATFDAPEEQAADRLQKIQYGLIDLCAEAMFPERAEPDVISFITSKADKINESARILAETNPVAAINCLFEIYEPIRRTDYESARTIFWKNFTIPLTHLLVACPVEQRESIRETLAGIAPDDIKAVFTSMKLEPHSNLPDVTP